MKTIDPNNDIRLQAVLLLADLSKEIDRVNRQTLEIIQILLDDARENE